MKLITVKDFCNMLGVTRQLVHQHINKSGKYHTQRNLIKATQVSPKLWLIPMSEAKRFEAVRCGKHMRLVRKKLK